MLYRIFLALWSALWTLSRPLIHRYLVKRARKDALYADHLDERDGHYPDPRPGAMWFHAVSLGEVRSAEPLMRAMLARGEHLVITTFTPTGRRAAERMLAREIGFGEVRVVWVPLELAAAWRRFFEAFRPKLGLVMEIEIWPRMVEAAREAGVPLFMCNAQYPLDSMARDAKFPLRPAVMRRFAGALVKSELQAERFRSVGVENVMVTGELRFDQPIAPALLEAAAPARAALVAEGRRVITLASIVEPEEEMILDAIASALQAPDAPFFVLVPRAPERFNAVADQLAARGIATLRRSQAFDAALRLEAQPGGADVLLGDSLGEMYFYLRMGDRCLVGSGFTPKGSHNIIEPLSLGIPAMVGPDISTIEYPAVEAIAAGVCRMVQPAELPAVFGTDPAQGGWPDPSPEAILSFLAEHSGATARSMASLAPWLK